MALKKGDALEIPASIVGRSDVRRLSREMEALNGKLDEADRVKTPDSKDVKISRTLDEIAEANKLDLNQTADRHRLFDFLHEIKTDAPVIHMSFAVNPPTEFTDRLVTWLRSEIHPLLLLEVGLQPTIAAGCVIRTTNKYFDCSMRQHLQKNRPNLLKLLHGGQPTHA